MTLIINNKEVESLLDMGDYMRLLEEAALEHADGGAVMVPRIDALVPNRSDESIYIYGSMQAGSVRQQAYAVRVKSDVVYWERSGDVVTEEKFAGRRGLYCGLVFLFSAATGEPLAIIHDGYIQHMRVGARVGLSAKYLAREDARTIGVVGSGGMARSNVIAICKVGADQVELAAILNRRRRRRRGARPPSAASSGNGLADDLPGLPGVLCRHAAQPEDRRYPWPWPCQQQHGYVAERGDRRGYGDAVFHDGGRIGGPRLRSDQRGPQSHRRILRRARPARRGLSNSRAHISIRICSIERVSMAISRSLPGIKP